MMRARLLVHALLATAAVALLCATPAAATFHLIKVREVYAGSSLAPEAKYVELQMYASGQNHVKGHSLRTYDAGGGLIGTSTFAADVAGSANQSAILLATPAAEAQFGIAADTPLANPAGLSPAGGAVCWEELDCVSWGSFAGSLPSPAGTPAEAIPDGKALQRTIARGCPTELDTADDSNDSSADFSAVAAEPHNNTFSGPKTCTPPPPPGEGGTGSGGGSGAPQTFLRHKPAKRTTDRTPTFGFAANEPGARFQCKLDGKPYRTCRSPLTTRRLAYGRHRFRVRAVDSGGTIDPTPASYSFKVVRG